MARSAAVDDASLKRLGGGRWQTRDERFTIEPESGTWVVVDAEQTDDLGLPLVRGPFRSLGDAKEAISAARSSPPATSPLAGRRASKRETREKREKRDAEPEAPTGRKALGRATKKLPETAKRSKREPEEPEEPRWFAALDPDARRQARRLIVRLEEAGAPDPEGMARRDVVGDIAAVAGFAITRRLAEIGKAADGEQVAALLADGRDDDLGVRWRLVDGDGRPITIRGNR
jgi:inactivated superfamily I helicase